MTRLPRSTAPELMDAPTADLATLERTYARFGVVNSLVAGWRAAWRNVLRPRLSDGGRLLDVGTGGGDVPAMLSRWARADGIRLDIVGIDPDERAIAWARRHRTGLDLRLAHSSDLVAAGERFDAVVSNHVLHHLDARSLGSLLADSEALAPDGIVLHSDLERSRAARLAFGAGTALVHPFLFRGSFIRADGLTSIARSHTAPELAAAVPAGWRVERVAPWRLRLRRG